MNPTNPLINNQSDMNPATNGIPRHIKVLTTICLILGIITIVGIALTAVGLVSGVLISNPGVSMMSSMLLGVIHLYMKQIGLTLCTVNIAFILVAKNRYNISIKKPLIITVVSLFVIYLPTIILRLLLS